MLAGEPMASQPPWTTEQGMTASESSMWEREGRVGSALDIVLSGLQKVVFSPTLAITAQVTRESHFYFQSLIPYF